MPKLSVLEAIKELRRPVFTTHEINTCCEATLSNTVQTLNYLSKQGMISKITRGVWGLEIGNEKLNAFKMIPFLLHRHRAYLSFISALHLYGIIEQIPQMITVASTGHTRIIQTKFGAFYIHKIAPSFFKGFDWYKGTGGFLIAEPEKAFIDCLYISTRRKKQFGYFPELYFPKSFRFNRAKEWAKAIPDAKIRAAVLRKLKGICVIIRKSRRTQK